MRKGRWEDRKLFLLLLLYYELFILYFYLAPLSLTHSQILALHYTNISRQVLCGEHDTATIHGRRQSQLHRDASEQNFKKSARHGNGASRERASTLGCKKTSGSLPLTQG